MLELKLSYHTSWEMRNTQIAYASRSLAPAENYSQIDKEALAVAFGVRHFHQYLYGRSFTIKSDH